MDRTLLHAILALDSIYGLLTWFDRCYLHLCIVDKEGDLVPSERVSKLGHWIKNHRWQSPGIRIGDDRLEYYLSGNHRIILEDYPKYHIEITKQLKNIYNEH